LAKKQQQTVFGSKAYEKVLTSIDKEKIFYEGKVLDANLTRTKLILTFNLHQQSDPMMFNCDFNGQQKKKDGDLIISREKGLRVMFGMNDMQNNFNISSFIQNNILFRGGIRTDKNKKEENVNLTSALQLKMQSNTFDSYSNDQLGFKVDETKEQNHLTTTEKYENASFDCTLTFNVRRFLENLMGKDFAQANALKKLVYNEEEELQDFIDYFIPLHNNTILDMDKLHDHIKKAIKNLENFDHGNCDACFGITDINSVLCKDHQEYTTWYTANKK